VSGLRLLRDYCREKKGVVEIDSDRVESNLEEVKKNLPDDEDLNNNLS